MTTMAETEKKFLDSINCLIPRSSLPHLANIPPRKPPGPDTRQSARPQRAAAARPEIARRGQSISTLPEARCPPKTLADGQDHAAIGLNAACVRRGPRATADLLGQGPRGSNFCGGSGEGYSTLAFFSIRAAAATNSPAEMAQLDGVVAASDGKETKFATRR